MAEENKDNNEDNKDKKKKAKTLRDKITNLNPNVTIGKIGRMNTETGKVEEVSLEDLSEDDLEKLNETIESMVKEMDIDPDIKSLIPTKHKDSKNTNKSIEKREELVIEKAQQDIMMNAHQVEKNRLFTLFDVITNTKELLIQRMNEHGKADLQHHVAESTKIAATNVIDLCLKQVFTWVEKNDINGLKTNFKPTDPETLTKKSFLKKDE